MNSPKRRLILKRLADLTAKPSHLKTRAYVSRFQCNVVR
jgi:hypothetical protein